MTLSVIVIFMQGDMGHGIGRMLHVIGPAEILVD